MQPQRRGETPTVWIAFFLLGAYGGLYAGLRAQHILVHYWNERWERHWIAPPHAGYALDGSQHPMWRSAFEPACSLEVAFWTVAWRVRPAH
jgi:hypothetical protein